MALRGISAKIDLVELEKLAAMQATDEEIGAFFGVSARTILRRKKIKKFADVMERGRAKGRLSVRRLQMKMLEQGNATMGIWLGKQILGQSDNSVPHIGGPTVCILEYSAGSNGRQLAAVSSIQPAPFSEIEIESEISG